MSDPRILALPGNKKKREEKKRNEKEKEKKKGKRGGGEGRRKKAAEKYSLRKYRSNNLSAHVARKKLSKAIYGEIYRYVGHRCIIHSALGADPIHSACDFASTMDVERTSSQKTFRPCARAQERERDFFTRVKRDRSRSA